MSDNRKRKINKTSWSHDITPLLLSPFITTTVMCGHSRHAPSSGDKEASMSTRKDGIETILVKRHKSKLQESKLDVLRLPKGTEIRQAKHCQAVNLKPKPGHQGDRWETNIAQRVFTTQMDALSCSKKHYPKESTRGLNPFSTSRLVQLKSQQRTRPSDRPI